MPISKRVPYPANRSSGFKQSLMIEKPKSEEEAKAPSHVFWDINMFPVPSQFDPVRVRPCIKQVLNDYGYSGPLSITAVGDLKDVPDGVLKGLCSSGIALSHTLPCIMYMMLSHVCSCLDTNPPPATLIAISDPEPRHHYFFQHVKGYNFFQPFPSVDTFQSSLLAADSRAPEEETVESAAYWDCDVCGGDPGRGFQTLARHLSSKEHHQLSMLRLANALPMPSFDHPHPVDLPRFTTQMQTPDQFWAAFPPPPVCPMDPAALTSVFWDMTTCPVPPRSDPRLVGPCIKQYLESLGYSGPLTITAAGLLSDVPLDVQQAVSASGIILNHVPRGSNDIVGLVLKFTATHKPPANIVLITNPVSLLSDYIEPRGYNRLIIPSLENVVIAPGAPEEHKKNKKSTLG